MKDRYAVGHGVYRKRASIDGGGGQRYRLVHPDILHALSYRFDRYRPAVWKPGRRDAILYDIENFWDGPTEVKHLGGGELEYTSAYTGAVDRFNINGYYNEAGQLVAWSREE